MKNKNRFADSASIIAAIGASLCCIGPLVLIALGFGTLAGAVSAFFAPLRPYLLAVAFGIVGLRLFVLYRGASKCAPATCSVSGRGREKALTWGVLGVVAIFAASPYLIAGLPSPSSDNPVTATKGDICLALKGMTCSACAQHIEKALLDVPGVKIARVKYDDAEACLTVENPASVDHAALILAVESAGYQAEEK